ncbi:MAG: hypothetical protein MZV64_17185 [Ignavibacteriales bacterium]|nr:hypothetical protein [Ignavibacteriales bacterium]
MTCSPFGMSCTRVKNVRIGFEQFERQPAFGVATRVELNFIECRDELCDLAFDLAAVIKFEKFVDVL